HSRWLGTGMGRRLWRWLECLLDRNLSAASSTDYPPALPVSDQQHLKLREGATIMSRRWSSHLLTIITLACLFTLTAPAVQSNAADPSSASATYVPGELLIR